MTFPTLKEFILLEESSFRPISKAKFISTAKSMGIYTKEGLQKLEKQLRHQSLDNIAYSKDLNWLLVGDYAPERYATARKVADSIHKMVDDVLGGDFEKQEREDAVIIEKIKKSVFDDIKHDKDADAKEAVFKYWFKTPVDKGGMDGLTLDEWRGIDPSKLKLTTSSKESISRSANASVWTSTADATIEFSKKTFTVSKLHYHSDARSLS